MMWPRSSMAMYAAQTPPCPTSLVFCCHCTSPVPRQVLKKLAAARKQSKLRGWTSQLETDLLCEFWSRLAANREASSFEFAGFAAEMVAAKLLQMERAIDDPKTFRLPCNAPESQRAGTLAQCRLLATADGRKSLASVDGNGEMWDSEQNPTVKPVAPRAPVVVPEQTHGVPDGPMPQPSATVSPTARSADAQTILTHYAGEDNVLRLRSALQAVRVPRTVRRNRSYSSRALPCQR